jgi:transcription initiation factor TFIIF subunit beta
VTAPINQVRCVARETEETVRLRNQKGELEKAARKDLILSEFDGSRNLSSRKGPNNFIRNTDARKIRPHDQKYSRLDADILSKLLVDKFRQYKLWSLRRLKEDLRQPEAHLREVLGTMAQLLKSGPGAGRWALRPDRAVALGLAPPADGSEVNEADIAPDVDDMDEDEDMDDDGEMEDVV